MKMINTNKYGIIFNFLKLSNIYYWDNYTNHKFVQDISSGKLNRKLFLKYFNVSGPKLNNKSTIDNRDINLLLF